MISTICSAVKHTMYRILTTW